MTELMQQLLHWVHAHPVWAGVVVGLVAFAESVALLGILVPGVVIMFGIGALIAAGAIDFWVACGWAVGGAIAGDGLSYWLGRHYHEQLQQLWPFSRHPRLLHGGVEFFHRYGGIGVVIGRFFGPVRATIPLVAGMLEMRPSLFLLANVSSALLWAPAYLLPGMALGASLERASAVAIRLVIIGLSLLISVWLLWHLLRWLAVAIRPAVAWGALLVLLALPWLFGLHAPLGRLYQALQAPPPPAALAIDSRQWWASNWADQPATRQGLYGDRGQPLNVQFAGQLPLLADSLQQAGWTLPPETNAATLARWLSPDTKLHELPMLPRLHDNQLEAFGRVQLLDGQRLVLRLWPGGRLADGQPLWLGEVTVQQPYDRLGGLFRYAIPVATPAEAQWQLWQDLVGSGLWLRRTDDGRLLIRQPPPAKLNPPPAR